MFRRIPVKTGKDYRRLENTRPAKIWGRLESTREYKSRKQKTRDDYRGLQTIRIDVCTRHENPEHVAL